MGMFAAFLVLDSKCKREKLWQPTSWHQALVLGSWSSKLLFAGGLPPPTTLAVPWGASRMLEALGSGSVFENVCLTNSSLVGWPKPMSGSSVGQNIVRQCFTTVRILYKAQLLKYEEHHVGFKIFWASLACILVTTPPQRWWSRPPRWHARFAPNPPKSYMVCCICK